MRGRRSSSGCGPRATRAVLELHARVRHRRRRAAAAARGAAAARRGARRAARPAARRARARGRKRAGGGAAPRMGADREVDAAAGPDRDAARGAGPACGDLRPGRARAVSEHGRDGRGHGAGGGGAGGRRVLSAARRRRRRPRRARRVRAVRGRGGLPDGRRAGRRRARAGHRVGDARRRDRRPRQRLRPGGQAPGLSDVVGHRLASPARASSRWCPTRRPTCAWSPLDLLAQAEHGTASLVVAVCPPTERARRAGRSAGRRATARAVLVDAPDLEAALAFVEDLAPEHLQLIGRATPRAWRRGCAARDACSWARPPGRRSGTTWRAPTTCSPPAARPGSRRRCRPAPSGARWPRCAWLPSEELAPAGAAIARAEGFVAHAESMEARIRDNGRDG